MWNNNQRTTISYFVSVKWRLLPKILFYAIVRLRGDDFVRRQKHVLEYIYTYIQCYVDRTLYPIQTH